MKTSNVIYVVYGQKVDEITPHETEYHNSIEFVSLDEMEAFHRMSQLNLTCNRWRTGKTYYMKQIETGIPVYRKELK